MVFLVLVATLGAAASERRDTLAALFGNEPEIIGKSALCVKPGRRLESGAMPASPLQPQPTSSSPGSPSSSCWSSGVPGPAAVRGRHPVRRRAVHVDLAGLCLAARPLGRPQVAGGPGVRPGPACRPRPAGRPGGPEPHRAFVGHRRPFPRAPRPARFDATAALHPRPAAGRPVARPVLAGAHDQPRGTGRSSRAASRSPAKRMLFALGGAVGRGPGADPDRDLRRLLLLSRRRRVRPT